MSDEFRPNIIGFACQWCAYQSADLAGTLKYEYPSTIKLIRVPCSGRVDSAFVLEALALGVDGVFVAGCPEAECHYRFGNRIAKIRTAMLRNILPEFGIESARLRFEHVSSSDAVKFVEFAKEFDKQIRKLGPTPLRGDKHE
jgi:coenzyme F420-reducing hydrogenase delta subunit